MKIGIFICNRYHTCSGGKCFRSARNKEGAFSIYDPDDNVEIVGYTTCGGCPGGNIEYAPEEMIKNGAKIIHLATGLLVGYPPCPHIAKHKKFLEERYQVKVIIGTHPIPQKYFTVHQSMGTWDSPQWKEMTSTVITDEKTRKAYD